MRKRATLRELHLKTSEIIREVVNGRCFIIEKQGRPVAELRPITAEPSASPLPDREKFLRRLRPVKTDSGRILEQDRT